MAKLNQILAIEKGKKTQLHGEITQLHKATQKSQLMTGHHKTFTPKEDDGEGFPDDQQHVQHRAREVIDQVTERLTKLMDVTATKDWANTAARADVMVEDKVILELKSVETVARVHKKQLLTYLRLADKRLGLLINFGAALIKDGITRVVNGLIE